MRCCPSCSDASDNLAADPSRLHLTITESVRGVLPPGGSCLYKPRPGPLESGQSYIQKWQAVMKDEVWKLYEIKNAYMTKIMWLKDVNKEKGYYCIFETYWVLSKTTKLSLEIVRVPLKIVGCKSGHFWFICKADWSKTQTIKKKYKNSKSVARHPK